MSKKELGRLGFEAIEFVIRKFLAKNKEGIATIPGRDMKDKVRLLVDKYAKLFSLKGKDVNKVTVKEVQNEIDYGMALSKQRAKEEALKKFPPETHKFFGRPLTEKDFKEIDKLYPPKKDPFQGFTPKIVPKETDAQIKARMIKENRRNVQKSYLRQLDEKILKVEEGFLTKADLDNMSPDALDSLRRNVDPHGMHKHFGSEEIGKIDDFASGGIAGELHLNRPGYFLGTLVKLLRGGKNVYRGTSTGGGVGGHFVPESKKFLKGKYYTTDKKEAEMYAELGKGILGIKKLTLSKKEFEKAKRIGQKFHEEIILPKKLAKKAEIDIPSSIKVNVKKIIKDIREGNAEGGRASLSKGGLAKVLGV